MIARVLFTSFAGVMGAMRKKYQQEQMGSYKLQGGKTCSKG